MKHRQQQKLHPRHTHPHTLHSKEGRLKAMVTPTRAVHDSANSKREPVLFQVVGLEERRRKGYEGGDGRREARKGKQGKRENQYTLKHIDTHSTQTHTDTHSTQTHTDTTCLARS